MKKANIGMIGLAVMGENLAKNIESRGYSVSVYDIDQNRVSDFKNNNQNKNFITNETLKEFVLSLEKPRKIMLMIRAGDPVDEVISNLIPLIDREDIIIDGGNSNYLDTIRRTKNLESKGIYFIGSGVSGGELGALTGPSIMPGGSKAAWVHVEPIFKAIAADVNGVKCSEWIGSDGAGHFVKMVHNGIEYGDMQLIAETYDIMRNILKIDHDQMARIFNRWNNSDLESYLIEITANILAFKDNDNSPLVTKILDKAGQKGTGKWTAVTSLEENVPLTLITESVYARIISSKKDERVDAEKTFPKNDVIFTSNQEDFINHLEKTLFAAKIISYAQGFDLMKQTAISHNWDLNFVDIAKIWRGGCIIRSKFLNNIMDAYLANKDLVNLMMDKFFSEILKESLESYKVILTEAIKHDIPTPTLSSALNYFNSYRTGNLPTNLIQAQRDYFGAHTYERTDKKSGEFFHTNWTGKGGKTSSTTYNS